MESLTGKELGPYQIAELLGRGGMAAVYKAYQPSMDRDVALKILPGHYADQPDFVSRFRQEAKIIARLQHPHILPVYDFGEFEGHIYIVMPYVESGTLADSLQSDPLAPSQISRVVTQVGDALDYAHSRGLLHRDIKPGNILLDERGNCLLSDFGLAKLVEGSDVQTASGAVMGTPAYMSPEQGMGITLDERSDIYALGVVLYEMATGRPPFQADTPIAVLIKHMNDPLPPPRGINPTLSEGVERVILKALAKRPEDRFQTGGDMARALQAALSGAMPIDDEEAASLLTVPLLEQRTAQVSSRRRITLPAMLWAAIGLVVVAAAAGLLALSGLFNGPASPPPEQPVTDSTDTPTQIADPASSDSVVPIERVCYAADHESGWGSLGDSVQAGLEDVEELYGMETTYLTPDVSNATSADYEMLMEQLTTMDCDLIVTAGFNFGDITAEAAKENPLQRFLIMDVVYDPAIDNIWANAYSADQGAFMAGYAAASVSQTGKVGTYGGHQFPTVEDLMDGFALGVAYYNEQNEANVEVVGWEVATRRGYFTNDFDTESIGYQMGMRLLDEGVDVIFPVAGFNGTGSARAALEHGDVYIIGVDNDWHEVYPEYADIVITSVEKRFDLSAISAVTAIVQGRFEGGTHVGSLANGEVGLSPFRNLGERTAQQIEADLVQIKADIITGKIQTKP